MTNTKFRKRALLSSVAMLLVALVALGSATFAWFTTNKTVNASGVQMTTTAQAGLMVLAEGAQSKGDDFAKSTTLGYVDTDTNANDDVHTWSASEDFVLNPASFMQTLTSGVPNFAATTSDDPNDAIGTTEQALSGGNASFSEKVFLKSTGGDVDVWVSGITINYADDNNDNTPNNAAVAAAVRVLVVDKDGNVKAHVGGSGATTNYYLTADSGVRTTTAPATVSTAKYNFITPNGTTNNSTKLTSQVGTGGSDYVMVYIYLDGEDAAVKTSGVSAQDIISSVDVQFSIA